MDYLASCMASGPVSPAAPGAAAGSGNVRSLVLRAWLESEVPRLRARIVEIAPGGGEQHVIVTTSLDEACRAVRDWLETLQAKGTNKQR
jgi:hypothetical protein